MLFSPSKQKEPCLKQVSDKQNYVFLYKELITIKLLYLKNEINKK